MDPDILRLYRKQRRPHIINPENWHRYYITNAKLALHNTKIRRSWAKHSDQVCIVDSSGEPYISHLDEGSENSLLRITIFIDDDGFSLGGWDCCGKETGVSHKSCGFRSAEYGESHRRCVAGRDIRHTHECYHKCIEAKLYEDEGAYGIQVEVQDPYLHEWTENNHRVFGYIGEEAIHSGIEEARYEAVHAFNYEFGKGW